MPCFSWHAERTASTPVAVVAYPRSTMVADSAPEELPEDLDITAVRGVYTFPDIRRRRVAGWLLLALAGFCLAAWTARGTNPVLVNRGTLGVAIALLALGTYHLASAWPLAV